MIVIGILILALIGAVVETILTTLKLDVNFVSVFLLGCLP